MDQTPPLIQFPCHCGHRFALTAEHAAADIQCPRCGRLNDVPTLSDLASISTEDGTLIFKDPAPTPPARGARVAEIDRAFRPRRTDDAGNDIDLRHSLEDLVGIGAPPESDVIPLQGDDARPAKPKYDPVTGELIRPMAIKHTDETLPRGNIPVAKALTSIAYASGDTLNPLDVRRVLLELLMPVNVVVMLFILVIHVINQMSTFALVGGFFFIVPVTIILTAIILSHYGNVIDETGPEAKDELPRPIRGMSFSEDIWRPFVHVAGSLMICYLPAYLVWTRAPVPEPVARMLTAFLVIAGSIFFPAVLLTNATSGTLNNLRPDRLIGVIRTARGHYLLSLLLWFLTLAVYVLASTGSLTMIFGLFAPAGAASPRLAKPILVYPMLMIAIYLAHFFCWHLGLIYREHGGRFPWIMQRHVSARFQDEMQRAAVIRAQRRKPRYVDPVKTKMEDGR